MKWTILVETEAKNMDAFWSVFHKEGNFIIATGKIMGVLRCDPDEGENQ